MNKEYKDYCRKNKLEMGSPQSAKMYYYYKEASEASTDFAKKEDMDIFNMTVTEGTGWIIATDFTNGFSLAPIAPQDCAKDCSSASVPCATKKQGNKPMYIDNDKHIESSKVNYLTSRAENVYYDQERNILKAFGLVNDEAPSTATELVKRIQDGKYVVKAENAERIVFDPTRYITWRDPAVKEDKEGAKAANVVLRKLLTDTNDAIAIGTPAEGLAAVKALDAWTPSVTASSATAS